MKSLFSLLVLLGWLQFSFGEITNIPVKLGDRMLFIKIDDIIYFSADEKYVTIHTKDGKTYLSDSSLKSLEEKLTEKFIRVHRSLLVNIKQDQGN